MESRNVYQDLHLDWTPFCLISRWKLCNLQHISGPSFWKQDYANPGFVTIQFYCFSKHEGVQSTGCDTNHHHSPNLHFSFARAGKNFKNYLTPFRIFNIHWINSERILHKRLSWFEFRGLFFSVKIVSNVDLLLGTLQQRYQWRHLLLLICQHENYWLVKQRVLLFHVLNI